MISEVKSHLYDLQRDNQDREVFKVVAERATKRIIKMWKEKLRVDDSIGVFYDVFDVICFMIFYDVICDLLR